jgi:hypothetical protein
MAQNHGGFLKNPYLKGNQNWNNFVQMFPVRFRHKEKGERKAVCWHSLIAGKREADSGGWAEG